MHTNTHSKPRRNSSLVEAGKVAVVSYASTVNAKINFMNHRKDNMDLGIVESNYVVCLRLY